MPMPPQLLKAMAAKKMDQTLVPPNKKKGAVPTQFKKKVVASPAGEAETPQSSAFENRFLQKNPSKQTSADKKRLANLSAAAQRKLGK
jgi:hypothetical protein